MDRSQITYQESSKEAWDHVKKKGGGRPPSETRIRIRDLLEGLAVGEVITVDHKCDTQGNCNLVSLIHSEAKVAFGARSLSVKHDEGQLLIYRKSPVVKTK